MHVPCYPFFRFDNVSKYISSSLRLLLLCLIVDWMNCFSFLFFPFRLLLHTSIKSTEKGTKKRIFFHLFQSFWNASQKKDTFGFSGKKMLYLFETKQTKKALKKELIKWTSRQKCGRKKRKCLIWREKLFRLHFGWEEDKQNAETIIIPSGYVKVQMKPLIICHF